MKCLISTDIDECQLELDGCADGAECTDSEGSYTCACSVGYSGDGLVNCASEYNPYFHNNTILHMLESVPRYR